MRDLWIDFNDLEDGDEVETLASFAEPGVALHVGSSLIVGDDDGLTCGAVVVAVGNGLIRLRLDRHSLSPGAPASEARSATAVVGR